MAEFEALGAGGTEAQFQQFLSYLFRQTSTGLATPGVVTGLAVTQTATASASVLVASGMCVAQDSVLNGATPLVNNTSKTQDVLVANPAAANPRNDIVVFDAATKTIRVIAGTPNVTPTDPAVPATAVPLARLRILGSATSIPTAQIDDLRVFTGLAQSAKPRRLLNRSSDITGIPTGVETALGAGWQSDPGDVGTDITYANGIMTVQRPGLYVVRAGILFSATTASGLRIVIVGKNGTAAPNQIAKGRAAGATSVAVEVSRTVQLAANDTLQLVVYQSSGANGSVVAALETFWQVEWVGVS